MKTLSASTDKSNAGGQGASLLMLFVKTWLSFTRSTSAMELILSRSKSPKLGYKNVRYADKTSDRRIWLIISWRIKWALIKILGRVRDQSQQSQKKKKKMKFNLPNLANNKKKKKSKVLKILDQYHIRSIITKFIKLVDLQFKVWILSPDYLISICWG